MNENEDKQYIQSKLELIVKGSPNTILIVDKDLRLLDVVVVKDDYHRYIASMAVGKRPEDVFSDEQTLVQYGHYKQAVNRAIKEQISVDFSFEVRYNKELLHYYAQAAPYPDNKVIVYIRSIEPLKTGRNMQELINTIIDCLPLGVSVKDASDNFNYLYWNRFMEQITGINSEDIEGKDDLSVSYNAIMSGEERIEVDQHIVETGETAEFHGRVLAANGEYRDLEVTKFPLALKDGKPLLLALWRDVTVRKEIENTLKRTRILSKMALQASGVDTCLLFVNPNDIPDYENTIVQVNSWDSNSEEMVDISWDTYIDRIHPDDRPLFLNAHRTLCNGEASRIKVEIRTFDMEDEVYIWRELLANVQEYNEQGQPTLLLGCAINIQDRKGQELSLSEAKAKAENADKMKSRYLADMSHEIRTPLSAITGFSELMAFADSDEERLSYYEIIKTNNELLMQLINDILDLSKIEADAIQISYSPVDINELMDNVYASGRLRMPEDVTLVLEKGADTCVFGVDSIRLMQLVNNLLNNAIKNTTSGQIVMGYTQLPDNHLKFYVRDTGIGIAEDKLETLFTRFVKINDYVEGIGLGLAICYGLITKMQGSITAESVLGEGSTFSFILPSHP